jgi:serine/threonine protein phosphatase PrpC
MTVCPSCDGPVDDGERYCERCGVDLRATGGDPVRGLEWRSTTAGVLPCPSCGETVITADGLCDRCGRARVSGTDRMDLALPGVAGVTDRGLLRGRNEDALAVGRFGSATLAVVCDGVSTSPSGDQAARVAVDSAIVVLLDTLARGATAMQAIGAATGAAADAVAALPGARAAEVPPSCTYVSAVVTPDEITVGWVGDSRAYWVGAYGVEPRQLTVDDSPAAQLAATGVPVPGVDPHSVALLRWLGADAPDTRPRTVTLRPDGPGRLLVCSDGLSRYAKDSSEVVTATLTGSPDAAAGALTRLALEGGGRDNITVAVLPYPPPAQEG